MKKTIISAEEIALFRAAVKGVKRIKFDTVPLKSKTVSRRKIGRSEKPPREEYPFSDHLQQTVDATEKLFFARPSIAPKTLRALRRGSLTIETGLDLHGMNVDQARDALNDFLHHCVQQGFRCVHIIHGKGRLFNNEPPVLKNQVNNWLQQCPDVLAFSSAMPCDGGAGAVYVLLKRTA